MSVWFSWARVSWKGPGWPLCNLTLRYNQDIVSHFCSESRSIEVTSGLTTTPDLDTGQQAPGKRLWIKYWLLDPFPERGAKDKRVASPEGPQFYSAGSLEVLDAVTPGVLECQVIGRFRTQGQPRLCSVVGSGEECVQLWTLFLPWTLIRGAGDFHFTRLIKGCILPLPTFLSPSLP